MYGAGRPVISQYRFACASDGADSMFVYVAVGAAPKPPGGFKLFSRTSFDKLRDAWARFGAEDPLFPPLPLPLLFIAGVEVPLVERPSSLAAGVALPLSPWGVAASEASRLDASPMIALRFLLRR